MNQQAADCNNCLAEIRGSSSPIDGRLTLQQQWEGPGLNGPMDLGVVQLAPGKFHTVREVKENSWLLLPCQPLGTLPLNQFPVNRAARLDESAGPGSPGRHNLKRSAQLSPVSEPVSKQVATSQSSTSALPNANLLKITEVNQFPNFWAMPQALKEAKDDLAQAVLEDAAWVNADAITLELSRIPEPGWKRAIRARHWVKEETPGPSSSNSPVFKFNIDGPNRLDLIYMRALDALSPFGAKGQKGKVFHECAILLKCIALRESAAKMAGLYVAVDRNARHSCSGVIAHYRNEMGCF
ncbi:hypothetical protein DFH28DRAFT_931363 [Melampsora americana]|nr:hypothetical protein DFH28DRAFT_931363 [Melampsora americana]